MRLSERENYLSNATLAGAEWIPANIVISGASWRELGKELEDVTMRHPTIWPHHRKGDVRYQAMRQPEEVKVATDAWGCQWETAIDGLIGIVHKHPLDDWSKFDTYQPPDPLRQGDGEYLQPDIIYSHVTDWDKVRKDLAEAHARGELLTGSLEHGFLFLRLSYLRGFENMLMDMATAPAQFQQLIDMVTGFNEKIVRQYLDIGIDVLEAGDDLGTQTASICGARHFHRWITPAYQRLFRPCRRAGTLVALHSDGHIMDLMDEFAACGVDIVNPQDRVNGIDELAREVKGRFCIRLDIDRQHTLPYGTRADVRSLIEDAVRKLGSPSGGLEFIAGIYPPTPAENVDALADALEEFRTWWWDGRASNH